ncbi:MAG: sec-independent protein translocase protein TatB [Actinomycetota bacterium]|nr:sec-independent protein translocase protein TatB [Actinomycetota bacterium]
MFDIGTGEIIALAVLALLILGPDKLPRYAADAARFIRHMRALANDAKSEVTRELGPDLDGLGLRELNPRALVRKHVLEGLDRDPSEASDTARSRRSSSAGQAGAAAEPPTTAASYDPDTT